MKANAVHLLAIFGNKLRLEVPLFQRQYVWSKEQQWEPLWEDIARKFAERLEGRRDAPVHFLGAMVLDQVMTPTGYVERRQVIDGQQRLTTLQIFLAAFRDFCDANGSPDLANECRTYTLNSGMMGDPLVDRFKVWPTQLDRAQFSDVMASGSRAQLETSHPLVRQKYKRKPDPRPRMVEAYAYFADALASFFNGTASEKPLAPEVPLSARLGECFQALKNGLKVVVIDLEAGDDAQVIFETLNARGEPLLPADLLRNYIFLRAAHQKEPQETLYNKHWKEFDDPFWREEVKQGRLSRPRSDLFMQHFLASRQGVDIPIRHLFVEYKFWIEHEKPFGSVQSELEALAEQGRNFRRIIAPAKSDVLHPLSRFLEIFDIRTAYPLLLAFFESKPSDEAWRAISRTLESYLLRRAVVGLGTKNYNRVFLSLTKNLKRDGLTPALLAEHLASLSGESTEWPSDSAFEDAWMSHHAYQTLGPAKLVHILRRLSATYAGPKTEKVVEDQPLSVEHVMPQKWIEHWPLPDGSTGVADLASAPVDDVRTLATRTRHHKVQTIGNLTLLTTPLNASVSNSAWSTKKLELLKHSLLPLNLQLATATDWSESSIEQRGRALFGRALELWPRT